MCVSHGEILDPRHPILRRPGWFFVSGQSPLRRVSRRAPWFYLAVIVVLAGLVSAAILSNVYRQVVTSGGPVFGLTGAVPANVTTGNWYSVTFVATSHVQGTVSGRLEMNWTVPGAVCTWVQVNELAAVNATLACTATSWTAGGKANNSLLFDFSNQTFAPLSTHAYNAGFVVRVNAVWVVEAYVLG